MMPGRESPHALHVQIRRLVVDDAGLTGPELRRLPEEIPTRIEERLKGDGSAEAAGPRRSLGLADAIATAVAERIAGEEDIQRATAPVLQAQRPGNPA